MEKKRYKVGGECPQCACRDVSFLGPEVVKEKFIGDRKETEIVCPACLIRICNNETIRLDVPGVFPGGIDPGLPMGTRLCHLAH